MEVNNTKVSGDNNVGGAFGTSIDESITGDKIRYAIVEACEIEGRNSYVGGMIGLSNSGGIRFVSVIGTNIYGSNVNSRYIGGIVGAFQNASSLLNFSINAVNVDSLGGHVGGVAGGNYTRASVAIEGGYANDVIVSGGFDVGGVLGLSKWTWFANLYVNADVEASMNTTGGLVGYIDNSYMAGSSDVISIENVLILDSSITAPTRAGGLVGNIATEIYRDQSFYYNNYIDADVTSTNTSTGSLIIGGRPDENPYIENTYVYRYSTLNGNYVNATDDNIDNDQYLVRADLNNQSTFESEIGLGTTYWNYSSLSDGKYPKIKDSYLYYPELQTGVDLPTDPEITSINSLSVDDENDDNANGTGANINGMTNDNGITTQNLETLPTATVYPVSASEINVDFSSVPEGVSFTYYVNGEEKENVELTQKTYTFKDNYQDTLEIKLTNGTDEETITINPEDVRSEASLVGSNNAYLLGTSLYINGELQTGEYVNLYDDYALNSSGQVVDIATKQIVTNADTTDADDNAEASDGAVTTALQQIISPLHTYDYKGNTIEVYGTYSIINDNIKSQIYNIRSGQLSALANNIDMKVGNSIIDNYNNKEYQTILTTSGELVDLKEQLQYPNNFLSGNIKQIVQNTDAEKPEMMVLYNTGKVIVFNYVTGQVAYENDEKADSGLVNYLTRSFANIWNDYEDRGQQYTKSKELEEKLAKLPIEEAIKETGNNSELNATSNKITDSENSSKNNNASIDISVDNTNNSSGNSSAENNNYSVNSNTTSDNNYITVYNADTGEYEVYSEDEILNGEEENPVSETEKIKQNGLEGVYGYDVNEEVKPQANGAVIVISIIAVAVIALVILRKIIVKNSRKEKK